MFDVGLSEMLVIAVVALMVIGPERMPGVARTVGALLGRARRYVDELKRDIETEVDLEEFNRIKSTFYDAAKSVEQSVEQSVSEAREQVDASAGVLNERIRAPSETRVAAVIETHDAAVQKDFWPDTASTPEPEVGPNT